jgi:hypothetical protein
MINSPFSQPCCALTKREPTPLLVTPANIPANPANMRPPQTPQDTMRTMVSEVLSDKCKEILQFVSRSEDLLKQLLDRQEDISKQFRIFQDDINTKTLCTERVPLLEPVSQSMLAIPYASNISPPPPPEVKNVLPPVMEFEAKDGQVDRVEAKVDEAEAAKRQNRSDDHRVSSVESNILEAVGEEKEEQHRQERKNSQRAHSSALGRLVTSNTFEMVCMLVILVNTVYMGYHTELRVSYAKNHLGKGPKEDQVNDIMEIAFFFCYCMEFILKLLYWRCEFFRGHDGRLNMFDGGLLVLNLIDLMKIGGANLMSLRIVKLVNKFVKVMRMGRVVRFCKELRVILVALTHSMKTFIWTMLAMALMMYMIAVILVMGVADYLEESASPNDGKIAALDHWGSIGQAMLTNYKAVTAGEPWGEAIDSIVVAGKFYFWLWLVYIGLLMFSVLRVLTGILTQHAKQAFDQDHAETIETNMWELFRSIDEDGSGQVSPEEFHAHLKTKAAVEFMHTIGMNPLDLVKLIHLLDASGTGQVDVEEFVNGCKQVRGSAKNLDMTMQGHRLEDIAKHLGLKEDSLQGRMRERHAQFSE